MRNWLVTAGLVVLGPSYSSPTCGLAPAKLTAFSGLGRMGATRDAFFACLAHLSLPCPPGDRIMESSTRPSRRSFLKASASGAVALASLDIARSAHAAGKQEIKIGMIGCGNRCS